MPTSRDAEGPFASDDLPRDAHPTRQLADILRLLAEERVRQEGVGREADSASTMREVRSGSGAAGARAQDAGQQRRRRRTGTLVVVVLLGGGVLALLFLAERGAARRLRDGVQQMQAALHEVRRLVRKGEWEGAAAAAGGARAVASGIDAPALRDAFVADADELERDATTQLAVAARAAATAAWQREVEWAIPPLADDETSRRVDLAAAERELTARFAAGGLAPDQGGTVPADLAVDDELLFLLDEWSRIRRANGDEAGTARVLRLTMQIDPHVRRDALRAALLARDAGVVERFVRRSSPTADDATTLVAAARAMRAVGRMLVTAEGDSPCRHLLEATWDRHPDQPYVALELGRLLLAAGEPWNALRYVQAALALRPDSAPIRRELVALVSRGLPDWPAVERATREALRRHPDDPWLQQRLAVTLLQIELRRPLDDAVFFATPAVDARRVDAALALLESAVTAQPRADRFATWSSALVVLGKNADAADVAQRGIDLLHGVEPMPSVAARLWQDLGAARTRLRDDGAEAALRRAVALDPTDARGVWMLAQLLARARPGDAEELLTRFLAERPDSDAATVLRTALAEVLLIARKLVSAQRVAEQLVADRSDDASGRHLLARILRLRGFTARAREECQRAYDSIPLEFERLPGHAVDVLRDLVELVTEVDGSAATVALLQREIDRSVARASRASLGKPSADPALYVILGRAHRAAGEPILGTDALLRAIDLGLEGPAVHVEVADLFDARHEPQSALRWREHAVEQWPRDPDLRRRLARALLDAGRPVEAVAQAQECQQLAPAALWPRRLAADALIAAGETGAAVTMIEAAIAMDRDPDRVPDRDEPAFDRWEATFGLSLKLMGGTEPHFDAAERLLRLALETDPSVPEAWCNYAHTIWRQGRPAEALAPMQRGHELGTLRGSAWKYPSAAWIAGIEQDIARQARESKDR